MKIHDVKQGSNEWLKLRAGIPTASEFDAILTPKFAARTGATPEGYLAKKVAESWLGGPLQGFSTWTTDQGHLREIEAVPFYELHTNLEVERVGFITSDDGWWGCSPDGVLKDRTEGLEVKCPDAHTHARWLLSGVLPEQHVVQVHASLWITGFARWTFLSYARHFPPLIVVVERDEEIMEKLAEPLAAFRERYQAAMERMVELNDGSPPPKPGTLYEDPNWMKD